MGITVEEFSSNYPTLFHMSAELSWPSIYKKGLLSTTALLDLFEITGTDRFSIESCHRPTSVIIRHPTHGAAVIRDQKPMRESALRKCLTGCNPQQWYQFLNRKVFFWVAEERVRTLLNARAYRSSEHVVVSVNTRLALEKYGTRVLLSPLNSGSTIYKPMPRGLTSFQPFATYPYDERRKLRGTKHAVAEVAIDYSFRDMRAVQTVEIRRGDEILKVLNAG